MIEPAQGLLVLVIVILTALLVVIGLQVINILRELKKTLEKVNKILDDAGMVSENIAKPLADISGFFKMIGMLVDFVKERKQKMVGKQKEPEEEFKDLPPEKSLPAKSRRRFFHRQGKKLA